MSKKLRTPLDYLNFFTKDFHQDDNPKEEWIDMGNYRSLKQFSIDLPNELKIRNPYIVFLIFVNIKNYNFYGKGEKTAWEIPIKYKNQPFILAHQKFGFKIISNEEDEKINLLAKEAISNINKSIPFAEKIIEPNLKELVKDGFITLENLYFETRRRYEYFRELVDREVYIYENYKNADINLNTRSLKKLLQIYNDDIKKKNASNYAIMAMLDAFFSFLEHILVLILPFIKEIDLSEIDIEEYIGYNWKNKYKIIFSLSSDKQALKLYENLEKIKELYRNPATHGYFEKNGGSFYVHMPHLGAIPMILTKDDKYIGYHFSRFTHYKFQEIINCFDSIENYIDNCERTKYGIMYIKKGLSIAYDTETNKIYKKAMKSNRSFKIFMNKMSKLHDDARNMDW